MLSESSAMSLGIDLIQQIRKDAMKIKLPRCEICNKEFLPKQAAQRVCNDEVCKRELNRRRVVKFRAKSKA